MRINQLFSILVMGLVVCACEQTVDVQLPYDKKIVINSFVGRTVWDDHAWISKTMPFGEKVTNDNSVINNAIVKIHWRDTTYDLTYDASQRGYDLPPADNRWQGDSLTMTVDWDGLHAEATAKVPKEPIIHEVFCYESINDTTVFRIVIDASVYPGIVTWSQDFGRDFPEVLSPMEFYENSPYSLPMLSESDTNMIRIRQFVGWMYTDELQTGDEIEITFWIADREYERYLMDRYSNGDEGPFGFGGSNPYFNVKGDGIGLFVPVLEFRQRVKVTVVKN